MPIAGQSSQNVVQQFLQTVLNFIKKKRQGGTAPSDGLILKLHYKWSFWFMLFIFSAVWYAWYHSELLVCVNKFNADSPVRPDYINFCSSYMYVKDPTEVSGRRYLFFYKWLHWVGLILAFVCYMPRKLSKSFENPRVLHLVNELYAHRSKYDVNTERTILKKVSHYIKTNLLTHNAMYYNALGCTIVAFLIDGFIWLFLDFVLHNRFNNLGWMSMPFNRDPKNYTDYLSQTFPPFAECNIAPQHELLLKRSETYGCHLVLMEFYEKVFIALWMWLLFLTTATFIYLVFLFLMYFPYFRFVILRVSKPDFAEDDDPADYDNTVDGMLTNIVSKCKIGDVWLLYKLRKNLSPHRYYMLLGELSEPVLKEVTCEDPTLLPSAKEVSPQLMQYIPTMNNNNMKGHPQHGQQFHPSMMHLANRRHR